MACKACIAASRRPVLILAGVLWAFGLAGRISVAEDRPLSQFQWRSIGLASSGWMRSIYADPVFLPQGTAGTAGLNAGHAAPAVGAKTFHCSGFRMRMACGRLRPIGPPAPVNT